MRTSRFRVEGGRFHWMDRRGGEGPNRWKSPYNPLPNLIGTRRCIHTTVMLYFWQAPWGAATNQWKGGLSVCLFSGGCGGSCGFCCTRRGIPSKAPSVIHRLLTQVLPLRFHGYRPKTDLSNAEAKAKGQFGSGRRSRRYRFVVSPGPKQAVIGFFRLGK